MAWVATAIIGSSVVGAGASIYGSQTAAKAQRNAAGMATNAQLSMFDQAKQALQPFIGAGQDILPTLKNLLTPGQNMTDTLSQIPGFKFLQDWGQKAVQNQGSQRGLGGNVGTALVNFATGAAENQGFFPLVQSLQGFANMGSGAAGSLAGGAVTTGGNIGGNIIGAGNATAGANIATGNAVGGVAGSVGNLALLNALTGGNILGQGTKGAWTNPEGVAGRA